ncbi:uncharacterized protein LOC126900784 isoform X3 [Daktulosphaira vitifoliae]|uniref:uncharacterized protein LOC126900784 isoform X3 n=1 Tax=Daktulosphaira vitifoliae TaxID=58002 RepID=UPI0021AAD795|nr:uncharacterized protein LOC126900784 isoform X3 [Daktulosphaira vitifoliae]
MSDERVNNIIKMKVKRFFRRLATLFKCCVSENKKHNTSGDVQLDVKNIECSTTQMNDIDVQNEVSVDSVSIVKQDNGDDMIVVENINLSEDTNDICISNTLTEEDPSNNSAPELKIDCIEDLLAVKQENVEDMITEENMYLPEDMNDLCISNTLTEEDPSNNSGTELIVDCIEDLLAVKQENGEEDHSNNSTPEIKIDCIEDLLAVKQENGEDIFAVEKKNLHDDMNDFCISYIFTEQDHSNNSAPELKIDCIEDLLAVKQENGEDMFAMQNKDLHDDMNDFCISYIFNEEDHPNNDSPELEVTPIEEEVSMETRKHEEGVIRYFGMNNGAGRIISKNGKCYKFYKKDIVGTYKYYKSPQKAKFVVNDSQPNWAIDVEIVGDIYGQRCYYCLTHGHYTEECMQLDIDSLNFYYPYI